MDCIINTACVQAITRDIAEDCENRIHSGIQHMAIIINKDDILGVAYDPANHPIASSWAGAMSSESLGSWGWWRPAPGKMTSLGRDSWTGWLVSCSECVC